MDHVYQDYVLVLKIDDQLMAYWNQMDLIAIGKIEFQWTIGVHHPLIPPVKPR